MVLEFKSSYAAGLEVDGVEIYKDEFSIDPSKTQRQEVWTSNRLLPSHTCILQWKPHTPSGIAGEEKERQARRRKRR